MARQVARVAPDALRRERDLLAALVDLGRHRDPETLVRSALALLVEFTGALHGRIEFFDADGETVRWQAEHDAHGDGRAAARRTISRGIIAQAKYEGALVHTACAYADERFETLESVRSDAIEAVLCAPIGARGHPGGSVYLQGATSDGPFQEDAEQSVLRFVSALEPTLDRLLAGSTQLRVEEDPRFARSIVARSTAMRDLLRRLEVIARLDVQLLLRGPSGSGKSALARAVHEGSRRKEGPFVAVNCAAMPETLFESELFGAAPGAHSAVPRGGQIGKVEAADGGTLFLDEVGDLGLAVQAKLLHLVADRQYYRLGDKARRAADIRIIAATHVDLEAAVAAGHFREDLYYRLRVLEAVVPGLDLRRADVPELVAVLAEEVAERHGIARRPIDARALRAIESAKWPGHVRQLAHALESATIAAQVAASETITEEHLGLASFDTPGSSLASRLEAFRVDVLRAELEARGWNVQEAAQALGIARSYAYKLIQRHRLRQAP